MNKCHKFIVVCFWLVINCIFFTEIYAQSITKNEISIINLKNRKYVSLYDILNITKIDHVFTVITKRGKLYHKAHIAVYQVGMSAMLVDGYLTKSDYPIIRDKGDILFPIAMFEKIIKNFYSNYKIFNKTKYYILKFQKKAVAQTQITKNKIPKFKKLIEPKEKIDFIIIDAGHGGKDPGAVGKNAKEKDITLKVVKYINGYLKKKLRNVQIKMTRTNDRFIELGKRTEIANKLLKKNNNGIFLSVHVNASLSRRISGYETYFLSQNATNEGARSTATLENNVIVLEDKKRRKSYQDVDYVEALMLTTQIQKESRMLAKNVQNNMKKRLTRFSSRGVKKADFFVLRGALMPAVLVEIGYITNNKELRYLKTTKYQRKVAESIANGVSSFIREYNKLVAKNK